MATGTDAAPRLRPLGIGELLDAAFKLCFANAGTLIRAVLVVVLPVQVLAAAVLLATVEDPDFLAPTSSEPGFAGADVAFWVGQGVVGLLSGVSFLLATGACFRAIAEACLGRRPDWRASLRFAAAAALPLLWISLLYGLGFLAGVLLCILPGIWLFTRWVVAFPVLFVEDRRGAKALARSSELVAGRWWPTFGVLVVGMVVAGIVGTVVGLAATLPAAFSDSLVLVVLLSTLGSLLTALLTTPLQAAIISLVYFDLRVRKEGFALEGLSERLGGGPGGDASASPFAQSHADLPEDARHQAPYWPPPPGWEPPRGWDPPRPDPPAGEGPAG